MSEKTTEIENRNIVRLGNEASKKLSQECIETALLTLMKNKNIEDITVSELVQKAGVSRAAFYRNYTSKQEVLLHSCSGAVEDVATAIAPIDFENDPLSFWKVIFETSAKYSTDFKMIVEAGYGQRLLEQITEVITQSVRGNNNNQIYDTVFWCGGIFNILIKWISSGMKESPKEMASIGMYIMSQCATK